jgi:phosphoribosyl 1,2-cyclic phosphodiesterase
LRFASLASGSSGNCLVAEAAGTVVMLDCGLNLTDTERRLQRAGLEPSQVRGILVTHEHGDHACGVFDFAAAHRVTVYITQIAGWRSSKRPKVRSSAILPSTPSRLPAR